MAITDSSAAASRFVIEHHQLQQLPELIGDHTGIIATTVTVAFEAVAVYGDRLSSDGTALYQEVLRAYLPGRDITAVSEGLALAAEQVNAGAVLLPGLTALVTPAQAREPFLRAEPAPPQPHSDEPTTTQRHSDALLAELDGLIGLDAVNGQLRPDRPQGAAGGGVSLGGRAVHR